MAQYYNCLLSVVKKTHPEIQVKAFQIKYLIYLEFFSIWKKFNLNNSKNGTILHWNSVKNIFFCARVACMCVYASIPHSKVPFGDHDHRRFYRIFFFLHIMLHRRQTYTDIHIHIYMWLWELKFHPYILSFRLWLIFAYWLIDFVCSCVCVERFFSLFFISTFCFCFSFFFFWHNTLSKFMSFHFMSLYVFNLQI